jgi:hypothetical protein
LTALTQGNDYLAVKQKIVTLMIACAAFGAMFVPTAVRTQQSAEKPVTVRITAQTVSVRQCIEPVDNESQREVSELLYRLTTTNLSGRPIIIYRYSPKAYDVRLSKTSAAITHGKFQYVTRPSFAMKLSPKFFDPDAPSLFRVLQPNQSFTYEHPELLTFLPVELIDTDKKEFEGQFFIQLKVATWYGEASEAEKVQQRWANYGDFLYQDVTTEPFPFTIEKAGATTPRCTKTQ